MVRQKAQISQSKILLFTERIHSSSWLNILMVLLKNVTILSLIIQDCTYKIVLFATNMSGLYITK